MFLGIRRIALTTLPKNFHSESEKLRSKSEKNYKFIYFSRNNFFPKGSSGHVELSLDIPAEIFSVKVRKKL